MKVPGRAALSKRISEYFGDYLGSHGDEIADIESLAVFLGMTREELSALETDEKAGHEISLARARIASIKKQLAFKGKIPAAVLSFDLKNNHGYRDRQDDEGEKPNLLILQGIAGEWGD